MFNRTIKAGAWLENYLLQAGDHRDLEQFVLIEGKARGFSEKLLRRVAADHRFAVKDGWWAITELRLEALQIRAQLAQGSWRPAPPVLPVMVAANDTEAIDAMLALRVSRRAD